jgi:hypothetical protein
MLLQELSKEKQLELRTLTTNNPKEYQFLIREFSQRAKYYPDRQIYNIDGWFSKDTNILGQHYFYNGLKYQTMK